MGAVEEKKVMEYIENRKGDEDQGRFKLSARRSLESGLRPEAPLDGLSHNPRASVALNLPPLRR